MPSVDTVWLMASASRALGAVATTSTDPPSVPLRDTSTNSSSRDSCNLSAAAWRTWGSVTAFWKSDTSGPTSNAEASFGNAWLTNTVVLASKVPGRRLTAAAASAAVSAPTMARAVNRFPLSRSSVRISIGFPAVLSGSRSRQRGAWLIRQAAVLLIPAGRHGR